MSFSIKLNRVTTCNCCSQDKPVRAWKHSFEQANQFDVVFNDDKDKGVISVKKNFTTLANLIEKQDATTRFKYNV